MSENRPTEWQWRDVDNDERIDGLTREEWRERGVVSWARDNGHEVIVSPTAMGMRNFCERYRYAPATAEMMPAAWPAKMAWQWRRLDADMDERTWRAVRRWIYGGRQPSPVPSQSGPHMLGYEEIAAEEGEWWAPADQDGNPCAWPEVEAWQWRKLERNIDEQTWQSRPQWQCGGSKDRPLAMFGASGGRWPVGTRIPLVGEWWAPADQDGNPCKWPEVETQPVVVIPSAEITVLVLYGHQAMDGTWRWRCSDVMHGEWGRASVFTMPLSQFGEWTPCDEHGHFCDLRRVVSAEIDEKSQWVAACAVKAERERDEWQQRAIAVRDEMLRLREGIAQGIAKGWEGGER